MKNEQGLMGTRRLIVAQLLIILVMARYALALWGICGALSVVLGGLVYSVPHACFAWLMFKHYKASQVRLYLKRVYQGEALKILLTFVFFGFIFCFVKCIIHWLFLVSFLIVQSTMWVTPWIFMTRECNK